MHRHEVSSVGPILGSHINDYRTIKYLAADGKKKSRHTVVSNNLYLLLILMTRKHEDYRPVILV